MRNGKILAALVSLEFLLSGCQTTFGLSAPRADMPLSIPKEMYFFVEEPHGSPGWTTVLVEFVPEVHASAKYIGDQNVHFVSVRGSQAEPPLINFPIALGGLTICIIPCFVYRTYTADFEVYLAQNQAHNPTKLHYEFSAIRGMWLPTQFGKNKPDPSDPIRELYRQFFFDFAELLNNSKATGEKHE